MFLQIYTIVCGEIRIYQTSAWTEPCARAARTHCMSENWSSSLRLDLSLKNSGKSSVVVWKNLPTGGPLDTQTYPRVHLKPPSEAGLLLGRLQIYPRVNLSILGTILG